MKARDRHDNIIVQEKLDGSCCAVAKTEQGQIVALGRAGYLAQTSPYKQHQLFAYWVRENEGKFHRVLEPGERIVGEWLAQAHGTRYELHHEPFVAFDLMRGTERMIYAEFFDRVRGGPFVLPAILAQGVTSIEEAMKRLEVYGHHGATDPAEGAVWRIERNGKVDFLVKYVRPDKKDGCFLPEQNGGVEIWNWLSTPLYSLSDRGEG